MATLKEIAGSRSAIGAAMVISRHLSEQTAQRIIRTVALGILAGRGSMYQAILHNQAQARGMEPENPWLRQAVYRVIEHAGRTYYDLFCAVSRRQSIPIKTEPEAWDRFVRVYQSGRAILAVGAHLSNFDLGMRYLTSQNIPVQILSLSEPPAGFQMMNQFRENPLCEVTPVSQGALRTAIRRLQAGGIVATGVDRPVPGELRPLCFFGRPAYLPMGHIRLALRTNAVVMALWCEWASRRGYVVRISAPIEMERSGNLDRDIAYNAQKVAYVLETAIARRPEQWLMFVPVWSSRT
jgi:phosphatidylinositol dimannoside acyltransferase